MAHTTAFVTYETLAVTRDSSMDPPSGTHQIVLMDGIMEKRKP